ncbi:hypothetical protein [Aeoliella mucimassa]|uniref:PEP-CTERM protein-sorting domain-containing protein n=1 Tax=Aeoliella mucimassa TaxID=2527972 RepID=A0A518ANC1_9BACT|nr:hypothetical protein [Aeoliella mucimassa]QDU56206.1 hypothetical protein Pan181_24140 [Aeoliella mucimassa]
MVNALQAAIIPAQSEFQVIGTASNSSNPSVWQPKQIDVTSFVDGSTIAMLSFDLRNDSPDSISNVPNTPTTARLRMASDEEYYFVNIEWFTGLSTSHFRDMQLDIDGTLFRDQFGAFNDHLGLEISGTVQDGLGAGSNILGLTGFEGRTFVLSVPEPKSTLLLIASLLGGWWLFGARRLGGGTALSCRYFSASVVT